MRLPTATLPLLFTLAACGTPHAPTCANPSSVTNNTNAPTSALNSDWQQATDAIASGTWCTDTTCAHYGPPLPNAATLAPACTTVNAVPDAGTNAFEFDGQLVHGYTDTNAAPCTIYVAQSQVVLDATYELQNCALYRLHQNVNNR